MTGRLGSLKSSSRWAGLVGGASSWSARSRLCVRIKTRCKPYMYRYMHGIETNYRPLYGNETKKIGLC